MLALLATVAGNATADHGTRSPVELLTRITVKPELGVSGECPKYNRKRQYKYSSRKLRERLLREQGRVTAYVRHLLPADAAGRDVHVEHIVAAKEAHESGACQWSPSRRRTFASDVLNLALAVPSVNRRKSAQDLGDGWKPRYNGCWYAATVVRVKAHYGLAMDRREFDAARQVIEGCQGFERDTRPARREGDR